MAKVDYTEGLEQIKRELLELRAQSSSELADIKDNKRELSCNNWDSYNAYLTDTKRVLAIEASSEMLTAAIEDEIQVPEHESITYLQVRFGISVKPALTQLTR